MHRELMVVLAQFCSVCFHHFQPFLFSSYVYLDFFIPPLLLLLLDYILPERTLQRAGNYITGRNLRVSQHTNFVIKRKLNKDVSIHGDINAVITSFRVLVIIRGAKKSKVVAPYPASLLKMACCFVGQSFLCMKVRLTR